MKKLDIAMLITGISSLVIAIALAVFAGITAVDTFSTTGGWDRLKNWFKDNDGTFRVEVMDPVLDLDDFIIIGDPNKVKVDGDGIRVEDGDDKVKVGKDGVEITSDDEFISVGKDGVVISGDDHDIKIGRNGISVQ